ncbi:MAG: hypothetical protein NT039_01290 [Candidatus Berkelbacteria bacterium]|nr:hypothetical protein [Candidatus Berkelbacteria bacterium]
MAAKKGGGLKQNLVWIVIIGVLGILAYFTLAGGNSGNNTTKTKNGNVAAVSTPKTTSQVDTGGGNTQNTSGKSLGASFNLSPKNGGTLGGSYLLKNLSMSKGSGYESANIFLKSISGNSSFPKYGASISGNTIIVTLSDTKNFDIDAGGYSYSGANPLTINGSVIKSIGWVQNGEDSIKINIVLKKQASFNDVVSNNPPTLEIRVAI